MLNGSGEKVRRDFSQKYSVVAPSATVSADIMNVLYAGYDNPMSISVPGVPSSKLRVSMTGGTFEQKGEGKYNARPTTPGTEAVITVAAESEGRMQEMGKLTFRVRKLHDPTAFIAYAAEGGGEEHFTGGSLSKQILMNTEGIGAAIDDGLLNIAFRVNKFEIVFFDAMGNAVPYQSNGAKFSDQQKAQMRGLARNKRFYIREIHATGPDGVERTLNGVMEVIIK
jgi:gliding motility-associated protein GldM